MSWAAVAATMAVVSAAGSIQQGRAQKEMYELQASQTRLKASRDALQYERAATDAYKKLLMTNANAAARGFAGGVQGFSGSAKLIQQVNEKNAGRDIETLEENKKSTLSFGEMQARMLQEAGDQAVTGSYFDAIGKLGMAAYSYNQGAPGNTTSSSSVPVIEKSFNATPSYIKESYVA
jgi:hypothetical protein